MAVIDISTRDRRAAQAWLVKMLDDPVRHCEGFNRWISGAPHRLNYYESLLGDVQIAGRAARNIRTEMGSAQTSTRRRFAPRLVVALVIVLITIFVGRSILTSAVHNPTTDIANVVSTKVGEVRPVALADGSTVTLDTDTVIHTDFTGGVRRIDLKRGRARFDVAHDQSRPFIVRAGDTQVTATGTVFDVSLRRGLAVHLLNGAIDVNVASPSPQAKVLHLRPGEQITLPSPVAMPQVTMAQSGAEQWTASTRSFENARTSEIVAEANLYSTTKILLADPRDGDREVFGEINIRDSSAVANTIATYLNLSVDRSQPGKLILTAQK
jgi:transmembrane sensor